MTSPLSRRSFIQTAGLALAASTLPMPRAGLAAEQKKWPVACRDIHLNATGKPDCWSALKALGTENVEVVVDFDLACPGLSNAQRKHTVATVDGIRSLQDDLAAHGCRITAFMMANRLDERLEQEIAWAQKVVNAARRLEVPAIRLDVWPHALPTEQFLPFAVKACKRLCALVEDTPIRYGVENHGHTTNRPEFLEQLFDGVGSPKLGLTLDCANFYWYGHPLNDLYAIYEKFAPRVVHTHCKSIRYPEDKKNVRREPGWGYDKYSCPVYEGDIDFKRLAEILRKADYRGDLCVEDESLGHFPAEQRGEVLAKEIAMLKGLA